MSETLLGITKDLKRQSGGDFGITPRIPMAFEEISLILDTHKRRLDARGKVCNLMQEDVKESKEQLLHLIQRQRDSELQFDARLKKLEKPKK